MTEVHTGGNGHAAADRTDFVHTGPGTLAGRYLRTFWQPVFRSQDLQSGKAAPIRVMSEDFTLYRGASGAAHALAFRCAHRGTQLSTGWVEGENIRCRYHGWVYDPTGQCVQQPAEVAPFCDRVRIRAYPTQEYLGFIFLYLGEGEPPPLPRYPALEGEGELQVTLHVRGCNYFNNMDNAIDELHHYFVHWNRRRPVGEQIIPRISGEETEYGVRITMTRPDLQRSWVWHYHMPGILQMNTSDTDQSIHWRVPIDDASHLIPTTTFTPKGAERHRREAGDEDPIAASQKIAEVAAEIRAGRMSIDDLDLRDNYFPIGDEVTQVGQGVIADRQQERLGSSDAALIVFRRLWQRELRALAEGRPLKQWTQPTEPLLATPRFETIPTR
ncbi:MAG TPA: Rieske 2Fe-2S domain-containing protein [Chloroflexota bacterium]|nr:Rieske 2Fe-2S domain-containing protein [Chloroflexota bacterium]